MITLIDRSYNMRCKYRLTCKGNLPSIFVKPRPIQEVETTKLPTMALRCGFQFIPKRHTLMVPCPRSVEHIGAIHNVFSTGYRGVAFKIAPWGEINQKTANILLIKVSLEAHVRSARACAQEEPSPRSSAQIRWCSHPETMWSHAIHQYPADLTCAKPITRSFVLKNIFVFTICQAGYNRIINHHVRNRCKINRKKNKCVATCVSYLKVVNCKLYTSPDW